MEDSRLDKVQRTWTNGRLREIMNENRAGAELKQKKPLRAYGHARQALLERYSIALACFVFVLVAIPLSIWFCPAGKSWGILLAISLMLVYYVLLEWGLSMVAMNKPLGAFVTFSPNLLFMGVGAGLWFHTLRS